MNNELYLNSKYLLMSTGMTEAEAITKIDNDIAALNVPVVIDTAAVIAKLQEEKTEWQASQWPDDKKAEMVQLIDNQIATLSA